MHMQLASSCLRIPTCLLGPQTIGHSERGASTRSASSPLSHIAVVWSSSTGGPDGLGNRVAAITGSTTESSDGSRSSIQPSNASSSSSSNIHVSWVIVAGRGKVRR